MYDWIIPAHSFTQAMVKISNVENTSISDVSDGMFLIINPTISLNSPNGGEFWRIGTSKEITWTSSDIDNVKLEYSTNNGTSWNVIIQQVSASSGSYNWTVPNFPSAECKVRISNISSALVNDSSNESFSIVAPSITLISPNGGEEYVGTAVVPLSWSLAYVDSVRIELSTDNGTSWSILNSSIPKTQTSVNWTVPQNINSDQSKIKISELSNSNLFDISEGSFSIINYPPTVSIKNYSIKFPDPNKQSSFRMFGLPGQSTSIGISQVVQGNHKDDWNVYHDNGATSNYFIEYDGSSTFNFAPGKGFWVISKNEVKADLNLPMLPLSGDGYYSIPLHSGWNIISNPFDMSIPWAAIKTLNSLTAAGEVIHSWSGGWVIANEMKVFEGYYYQNQNSLSALKIPSDALQIWLRLT